MLSKQEAATLIMQRAVLEFLRTLNDTNRAAAADQLEPGDAVTATHDGTKLGRVRMNQPRTTSTVDEDVLLAWCEKYRPDQIQTVTARRVYPAFLAAVKDQGGELVDPVTGEVTLVDGVTTTIAPSGTLVVEVTPDARAIAAGLVSNLLPAATSQPKLIGDGAC